MFIHGVCSFVFFVFPSFDYFPQIAKNFEKKKTADPMGPTTCLERYVHPWCLQFFFFLIFVFKEVLTSFPNLINNRIHWVCSFVLLFFSMFCSLSQLGVFQGCKWLFALPSLIFNSLSKELLWKCLLGTVGFSNCCVLSWRSERSRLQFVSCLSIAFRTLCKSFIDWKRVSCAAVPCRAAFGFSHSPH